MNAVDLGQQLAQVLGAVARVADGVDDQRVAGLGGGGAQGGPLAARLVVAQEAQAREAGGEGGPDVGAAVGAAVVDEQDLELALETVEMKRPGGDDGVEARAVVAGQQDDAEGGVGDGRQGGHLGHASPRGCVGTGAEQDQGALVPRLRVGGGGQPLQPHPRQTSSRLVGAVRRQDNEVHAGLVQPLGQVFPLYEDGQRPSRAEGQGVGLGPEEEDRLRRRRLGADEGGEAAVVAARLLGGQGDFGARRAAGFIPAAGRRRG